MAKRHKRIIVSLKEKRLDVNHGQVWDYDEDNPLIEIDHRLKGKDRLMILTHEAVHIAFPALGEKKVIRAAKVLASILWADRYRRVDQ